MNDAGDFFLGVVAYALPDTHYIPAGRIDKLASFGFKFFADGYFGAEGRNDYDIAFP